MYNAYGPTETTISCTFGELRRNERITIGRPIPSYHCRILKQRSDDDEEEEDSESSLLFLGDDKVGELLVSGVSLARGYQNLPQLTIERFPEIQGTRWYKTGDLAVRSADGNYELRGRADFQVKIRGQRVELEGIEAVLLEAPFLQQAAVFWEGDMVQAVVSPSSLGQNHLAAQSSAASTTQAEEPALPADSSEAALLQRQSRDFLRELVPASCLPQRTFVWPRGQPFPQLPSGKQDRKALLNWLRGQSKKAKSFSP